MNAYLSHETALEYWRANPASPDCRTLLRGGSLDDAVASVAGLNEFGLDARFSPPLDLLVADACARRKSSLAETHVCSQRLPEGSFAKVGRGVAASVPELCFVQMATRLSFPRLVLLGYELCGTYVERPQLECGFVECRPLTNTVRMRSYIGRLPRIAGTVRACKALDFVADGAASPPEAKVAMCLCLPTNRGGYALEKPRLNHVWTLSPTAASEAGRQTCRFDLYWPSANLCLEYNSDMWHTGPERIARDAKRTNALINDGVTVITVTREQLYSVKLFDDVAHIVARRLGRRLRIRRSDFAVCREALRREIFGGRTVGGWT